MNKRSRFVIKFVMGDMLFAAQNSGITHRAQSPWKIGRTVHTERIVCSICRITPFFRT